MSLRWTFNLLVALLTLLLAVTVVGWYARSLRMSVNEEIVAANRVASQLLDRTVVGYAAQGTPTLLAFLQSLGRVRSNEIKLYDMGGLELYRSPPSPYKAGRDAPAWFARVMAPAPVRRSITFDDGRIEVESNSSRAVLDAWDDLVNITLAALALLALVNTAVFWFVGRTTRPFAQIVNALERVKGGAFDTELPPLPGKEAGAIGAAFNRMVADLRTHIETERRAARAEAQLDDRRELSRGIDQHIEAERRMIARELHDEFGQSVTAMRSLALSIAQRAAASDPTTEQSARAIADESSRLYDAMHGIIPRLAPLTLDAFGLVEASGELVERTRRSHPNVTLKAHFDLGHRGRAGGLEGHGPVTLTPETALTLYRTAQEGITNALQHGHATTLDLRMQRDTDGTVTVELDDDGQGLPSEGWRRQGHYGLRWLEERVQSLGGTMQLHARAPRGTALRVSVPADPPKVHP